MPTSASRVFHACVLIYSVVFLTTTIASYAQTYVPAPGNKTVAEAEMQALDKRISTMEALAIDRRLGVIESIISDLKTKFERTEKGMMDYMSNGAIALMLGRTAYEVFKKERSQGDSNE